MFIKVHSFFSHVNILLFFTSDNSIAYTYKYLSLKIRLKLSMMAHPCNRSIMRKQDFESLASLGYLVRPCLKTKTNKQKTSNMKNLQVNK